MDGIDEIDVQAPEFGEFYDELPLWSARFALTLLDQITLRRGMTILDVGAGTGFLSVELAQRCGCDSLVIAVDPWQTALARLERKIAFMGLKNIRPLLQDVTKIDLADSSIDLIVSNLGINNFADPESAFRTCYRVAKPGADLYLTTNLVGHMAEFYDVYRQVLTTLGFQDRLAVLDAHIAHRATVESVQHQLIKAGFEVTSVSTHAFQERFVDGTALLRHFFIRLGFIPDWKSIAPADSLETTFSTLESALNNRAEQLSELSLTIPAAYIKARKPIST